MRAPLRFAMLAILLVSASTFADAEVLHDAARRYDAWASRAYDDWHALLDAEVLAAHDEALGEIESVVSSIDPAGLADDDLTLHMVLEHLVDEKVGAYRFGEHLIPFGFDWGPDTSLMKLGGAHPGWTRAELVEGHFEQIGQYGDLVRSARAFMAEGLMRGVTMPRSLATGLPPRLDRLLDGTLRERLAAPLDALDEGDRDELGIVFENDVWPALECEIEALRDFLALEYVPGCRVSVSAQALPDGEAYYAYRLRVMAETTQAPQALHDYGVRAVAGLQGEMLRVVRRGRLVSLGPTMDDDDAIRRAFDLMRDDARYHHESSRILIRSASEWAKGIDAWLPGWFHTLPRTPYAIEERDGSAPGPRAGYQIGDPQRGRAGIVYFRIDELDELPVWSIGPLILHEGSPGHHLQWGLAHEMEFEHEFQRTAWFAGFGEGWAMYAEHLGAEMGFEHDPVTRFGMLASHLHRAARVVVDTGVHALGWSRDEAIAYMLEHTPLTGAAIERDVDRMILWPGQACAYALNGDRLLELRRDAESALGDAFDLREFHHAVIGAGTVPMSVVERRVAAWIEASRGTAQPN